MSNEAPTDALRLVPVEPTEAMLDAVKPWPEHWPPYGQATVSARAAYDIDRAVLRSNWTHMLAAAPASPPPGGGWQEISTAPKDGTLFLGCNLDHPSFGSWPMYRRVKHGFDDAGEVASQDLGAWIKIIDVEPDFDGGSEVGSEPRYAIAADDLNKSVRYGWKPFPLPAMIGGA